MPALDRILTGAKPEDKIQYERQQSYQVDIRPLTYEDGGGFVATAPELPGCRSDGETSQEAFENIYDAIGCWIEATEEMGRSVPEPKRAAA